MDITHIILSLIIFMAGALSAYLLMLRIVGRHVAESAAKDALLERPREELGDANIKRAQVEERCNQLKAAIESEKENSAQMVKQIKELNDYALENIKAQLAHITEENLKLRGEELKNSNVEQLGHILAPLREQMRKMEESVRNVDISSAQHKVSIEKSIENLATQAVAVGKHADELARALKNNSKVQGDWGETILETILDYSGLTKGINYEVQSTVAVDESRNVRPDVVVRLPGRQNIIIDSKVSLTDYLRYNAAETPAERSAALKAHLQSVRRHVAELGSKEYHTLKESPDFVVMFVPNEPAFLDALKEDHSIWSDAYDKKVVVSSPTNLFALLKLVDDLWRRDDQNKNQENIIKFGVTLYEQLVAFTSALEGVGASLDQARTKYDEAFKRLSTGNNNIIRVGEKLRKLGLPTTKRQSARLVEESGADEDNNLIENE